jgi:hypothetical protein
MITPGWIILRITTVLEYSYRENENVRFKSSIFFRKFTPNELMWKKHGRARHTTDESIIGTCALNTG